MYIVYSSFSNILIYRIMFKKLEDAGVVKDVDIILADEKDAICKFLQGAVYCWCNNNPNQWFSMRDFMGGANHFWQGTPLYKLFEKTGNEQVAGQAAGRLLKKVIGKDKRHFDTRMVEKGNHTIREYKWIGDEI